MSALESQELITAYRNALSEAGHVPQMLAPERAEGQRSNSREAFEAFAQLRAAPETLSVMARFSELSRLHDREDFSVSCLPGTSRSSNFARACTISVGMVEVFYVVLDSVTGKMVEVVVFGEPNEDLSWLSDERIEVSDVDLDGGGSRVVIPGDAALEFLVITAVVELIAGRVAAIRARRRRTRREAWHNQWLWALVNSGGASPLVAVQPHDEPAWDVSSGDALRFASNRTSQQAFRRLLLDTTARECVICGIDVPEVLEAAHLVPHARGGAASSENGRLLCANHHRAFDAGLYQWTGSEFLWIGHGEEPVLGQRKYR